MWIFTQFFFSVPVEIDEYDLVDPVDILTPLEKSGFWDGVVCGLSWMHYILVMPSYEKKYLLYYLWCLLPESD